MTSRNMSVTFAVVTLALTAGSLVRADDYPQWRGLHRDGISAEKGLLPSWPAAGPKVAWMSKEVGFGYGSPAVSGGRLFIISSVGKETEHLHALDAGSGKLIWSIKLGKVGNPNQVPNYPGARSTPTVEGKLVYSLSSDGDLVCAETKAGKEVWRKSLRADFGGKPGIWAYAESPLIDGDRLICTPGGAEATVVALNKKTGATIWKSAVPGADNAAYASAAVAKIGEGRQLLIFVQKGLIGLDSATGKFLWRFDKSSDLQFGSNSFTPIAHDGLVYSASGKGGGLVRVNGSGGSFTAEAVYTGRKVPTAIGGAVRIGDLLFGTTGNALVCVDFATSELKWEERGVGAGSLIYADGNLYVHGENGDIALVEATASGYKEKGKFSPADQPAKGLSKAWAYPVIANGKLYVRDQGHLWCYDVKNR